LRSFIGPSRIASAETGVDPAKSQLMTSEMMEFFMVRLVMGSFSILVMDDG
jgi:hypothetical protein